jgi:hypothetical protein
VSDPFGTVCPLSAAQSRGPELLRRADQDISVSVAALALLSFSPLSCGNVSVVQLTGMSTSEPSCNPAVLTVGDDWPTWR